jgi:hypothetical protein
MVVLDEWDRTNMKYASFYKRINWMKNSLPVEDYQKLLFLKGEENIEGDGF